jgi:hypothetical protein
MTSASFRIRVKTRIEDLGDVYKLAGGRTEPTQVRSLSVDDAIVDPTVIARVTPSRLRGSLGLRRTSVQSSGRGAARFRFRGTSQFASPSRNRTAS